MDIENFKITFNCFMEYVRWVLYFDNPPKIYDINDIK